MLSVPLLIARDFNIHLDVSGNVHSKRKFGLSTELIM